MSSPYTVVGTKSCAIHFSTLLISVREKWPTLRHVPCFVSKAFLPVSSSYTAVSTISCTIHFLHNTHNCARRNAFESKDMYPKVSYVELFSRCNCLIRQSVQNPVSKTSFKTVVPVHSLSFEHLNSFVRVMTGQVIQYSTMIRTLQC